MAIHHIIVSALVTAAVANPAWAESVGFSAAQLGSLPRDFVSAQTGGGEPGRWEVIEDASADSGRALAQLSDDATSDRYPLAIYMPTMPSDLEVRIRFKPISGSVDRAGGVAVRLLSAQNYYLARANALEDNVRFYLVEGGRRQQLGGANVEVAPGEWHTLSVRAEGSRFTVSFDGKALINVQNDAIPSPGKVALWTKADSVTAFDRIEMTPVSEAGVKP